MFYEPMDATQLDNTVEKSKVSVSRILTKVFAGNTSRDVSAKPVRRAALFERADMEVDTLARDFDLFNTRSLEGSDIILYGKERDGGIERSTTQFVFSRKVVLTEDQSIAEKFLFESDAKVRLLVVAISDIDDAVEWLIELRQKDPEIVIIVTSPDFAKSDLSIERACICDASIREPVTPISVSMGLRAALNNRREVLLRQLN
ncbi:hypothetical protein [Celeribacter sp.]|uniref:hypothetical protein n=1 Tax=Celeribacter sp. TaxID=1890673 RepID=UPI003A8D8165